MVWFPSMVTVPLISSIVSLQWMFLSCRARLAAIRTPPCGSCGLSLHLMSKPRSFGSILLEAMLLSNQVSDPMIMSGSESMIIASRSFPFFLRLWKLTIKIRNDFFFGRGLVPGLGDDDIGWSAETNDWSVRVSLLV